MGYKTAVAAGLALTLGLAGSPAAGQEGALTLPGSWVMDSAYEILSDGTRVTNYGEHPRGLMLIDGDGRYSVQIFRPIRAKFASGDKTTGTPEEYREAVLGSSTHFGHVRADPAAGTLSFAVESASYPNWEGKEQLREYSYANGVLTYRVPASASGKGTIAYSVWRKVR